jgi:cytoskeleton protein RodZ
MNSERTEQPQAPRGLAAPGAQLKARREAMGWSIEQVSDQLKLAPRQVMALEEGDVAALPNLAVVRGFIRAYAKVVKLDAAPLVAMIDVNPAAGATVAPARREISATFSETRFPSLTQRSSKKPTGWIVGAVVVALAAAVGAYKLGYISPEKLMPATAAVDADAGRSTAPAGSVAAPSLSGATPAPAGAAAGTVSTPLISPSVPLISVPPAGDSAAAAAATAPVLPATPPTPAPASPPAAGVTAATVVTPAATTAAAATPAATGDGVLVLTVREDSWIQLRPANGGAALISRLVKAGNTESFNLTGPALLVVGKPSGVDATLRGAPLPLPLVPGGTTSRLNLK